MSNILLPEGFRDIIFPDAGFKADIVNEIRNHFCNFGYDEIETPLLEFEDSLFCGDSTALKNKAFRVMDPLSYKMLAVRNDITSQVIRLVRTRLYSNQKPIRLCYSGRIVSANSTDLYNNRQMLQTGIEKIGLADNHSFVEVIFIALSILENLGIEDLTIDFTLPGMVDIILNSLNLSEDNKGAIVDSIIRKDIKSIEQLTKENCSILAELCSHNLSIDKLLTIKLPDTAMQVCTELKSIIDLAKSSISNFKYSIDPLEIRDIGYHKDVGFSIFSSRINGEIAKGGRYNIDTVNGEKLPALGCSLYPDRFIEDVKFSKAKKKKIYIPASESLAKIAKLQDEENLVTIIGTAQNKNDNEQAKEMGCDFILMSGKIVKI